MVMKLKSFGHGNCSYFTAECVVLFYFVRLVKILESKLHSLESAIIHINESCTNSVGESMCSVRDWIEDAVLKQKNKAVSISISTSLLNNFNLACLVCNPE